jgi:hypothetical protein
VRAEALEPLDERVAGQEVDLGEVGERHLSGERVGELEGPTISLRPAAGSVEVRRVCPLQSVEVDPQVTEELLFPSRLGEAYSARSSGVLARQYSRLARTPSSMLSWSMSPARLAGVGVSIQRESQVAMSGASGRNDAYQTSSASPSASTSSSRTTIAPLATLMQS